MFKKTKTSHHKQGKILSLALVVTAYGLLISVTSCSSAPQLMEAPKITFNEETKAANESYVGTLEGCLVGRKSKPITKLMVDADLKDFLNITGQGSKTDVQGCYGIDLYWKNQPYLLADVYPDPAKNSFTTSGLSYLKSARTVSLDIPIVTGKNQQVLTTQPVTMYSISFVLKRIAEEVVNRRVRTLSYSVEDYETGFPIVGASVTITASSSILPVDSLLAAYISQPNLREVASSYASPIITQSETQIQKPKGHLDYSVMSFSDYRLTVTHPDFHSADEKLYIETDLDKIVRLSSKNQERRIDIIDR